jgi:predicted Zn-dependent peptidase
MKKYKKLTLKDFGVKRQERTLKNGCRVVLYEKKNSPLDLGVKFVAGSRFDPPGKEGLAHFLEHMLIAGSKKFKTKDQISIFLERYGGNFGLSTSNGFISIDANIGDTSDIDILITFLNEVINNPLFDKNSFNTEKGSIVNEIGESKNSPWRIIGEAYSKLIYKGTPMERMILGTEETVRSIKLEDIINFYKKNITPQNCTIVASGDIKIEKLVKKIEQKIKFKNKGENKINKVAYLLPKKGENALVSNNLSNQSLMIIGFRVGSEFEYSPALDVLEMALATGRASRLTKKLRYEKGLVYSIVADYNTYQDLGSFNFSTTTSKQNIKKVLKIIFDEIKNIKKNGITKAELDFIKSKLINSAKKRLQTSEDWVTKSVINEAIRRDGKTTIDFLNEIMKVTNKDIIEVSNKYFSKEKSFIGLYSKNK